MTFGVNTPSFGCPHCQFVIRYNAELAGRKGSCPQCNQVIEIPRPAATPRRTATVQPPAIGRAVVASHGVLAKASPSPKPAAVQRPATSQVDPRVAVLNEFRGPIEPVETTPLYKVGISLAAGVMLLLAVAYVGIIFGVAYLVYYHAVYDVLLFSSPQFDQRGPGGVPRAAARRRSPALVFDQAAIR